jgi:hypothetical protein
MKNDNINPNLIKYKDTFMKLHVPVLALTQLYIAFYRSYITKTVNSYLGVTRSFMLCVYHFMVMSVFLSCAIISRK